MNDFEKHHWSDCAKSSEPAFPAGACDCGLHETVDILVEHLFVEYKVPKEVLEECAAKISARELARTNAQTPKP